VEAAALVEVVGSAVEAAALVAAERRADGEP
jgi:hypothetical protein